jgi:hypothetical protein
LLRFDLNVRLSDAGADEGTPTRVFFTGGGGASCGGESGGGGESGFEAERAAVVTSLPPVVLSVILPADYPSTRAPHFALSASWWGCVQLESS